MNGQVRGVSSVRQRLTSLRQYELDQVQRVFSQSCTQDTPCRAETIAQRMRENVAPDSCN